MSTYYYFACEECKEYGGWFSRQAWGWGNMDIADSFAFLANHVASCGHENIRVISEHQTYDSKLEGWTHVLGPDEAQDELAAHERAADYPIATFPHSNDWKRADELLAAYSKARKHDD